MWIIWCFFGCLVTANSRSKRQTTGTDLSGFIDLLGPGKTTDIVVILDRGTSVGRDKFHLYNKELAFRLLNQYAVIAPGHTHVAVVLFHKTAEVVVDGIASSPYSKCSLFSGLNPPWDKVRFVANETLSSGTNIIGALDAALAVLNAPIGGRQAANKVCKKA